MNIFKNTDIAIAMSDKTHTAFIESIKDVSKAVSFLAANFDKVECKDHVIYHAKQITWDPNDVAPNTIVNAAIELFNNDEHRIEYARIGPGGVMDMEFRVDGRHGTPWLSFSVPTILY